MLQAGDTSTTEEQSAGQELARKAAEAHLAEGQNLKGQLQAATQDVRQIQVQVSQVVKKLVSAQQGVTSMRASMGRKRMELMQLEAEGIKKKEELRTLELEELRWMGVQNSTQLEQMALEETRVEKQAIAVDILGRLTCHLTGATEFKSVDVRDRQELLTEGRIAMDQARGEAPVLEDLEGLEESRRKLVRDTLKREQEVKDREVKERQNARIDALAKDKAAKELTAKKAKEALDKEQTLRRNRQAEETRSVEAEQKAELDRLSWEVVSPNGLPAKKRTESYHWPKVVGLRLVVRDVVPKNSDGYR